MKTAVYIILSFVVGVHCDSIVDIVTPEIVRNDIKKARANAQKIVDAASQPLQQAAAAAMDSVPNVMPNVIPDVSSDMFEDRSFEFDTDKIQKQINKFAQDRQAHMNEHFDRFAESSQNLQEAAKAALNREKVFPDVIQNENRISLTLEHVRNRRTDDESSDDDSPTKQPPTNKPPNSGTARLLQSQNYGPLFTIIVSMRNQWAQLTSFETFEEIQASFDYLRSNGIQPQLANLDLSPSAREFFNVASAFMATLPFGGPQGVAKLRVDENLASFLDRTVAIRSAPDFEQQLVEISDQLQTYIKMLDGDLPPQETEAA